VVYSLLDDLKATHRWRRFAESTAAVTSGIVARFKPRPRRKPAREATPAPEPTSEVSGD
jgi:hypothetical protein